MRWSYVGTNLKIATGRRTSSDKIQGYPRKYERISNSSRTHVHPSIVEMRFIKNRRPPSFVVAVLAVYRFTGSARVGAHCNLLSRPHRARMHACVHEIHSIIRGGYEFLIWKHSGRSERTAQPLVAAHRTASASIPFQLDENCVPFTSSPLRVRELVPIDRLCCGWG
jgi:hypothetical protein